MNPSYITFFPGKGIYYLPSGQEIVPVLKTDEARQIFSACAHLIRHGVLPKGLNGVTRKNALLLKTFYSEHGYSFATGTMPALKTLPELRFQNLISNGTRISAAQTDVDWDAVVASLAEKGYELKQRDFLRGELDDSCPVYYLNHEVHGVISEGKGLTKEQARKSALAEGIERLVGAGSSLKPNDTVVESYQALFADRDWGLGMLSGSRDLYSEAALTEWVSARNISRNEKCLFPAELAYFEYLPKSTGTRLFSLHHTMGLAAGSSLEDATLSGIFEVIERDSYWITMRCRINCPDIDISTIENLDSRVHHIIRVLKKHGFSIHIKDMSLDWGVPVAHAVLVDENGGIPAFSHGTGAAFDWATAVSRAVCEVVQMYTGLDTLTNTHWQWEEVVSVAGVMGKPELAWSDPLYREHLKHLVEPSPDSWNSRTSIHTVEDLLKRLRGMGHEVIVTDLHSEFPLKVVRVHITNATPPDTRLEKISSRLHKWRKGLDLKQGFYADPILT